MSRALLLVCVLWYALVPLNVGTAYERTRPRWKKASDGRVHAVTAKHRRHHWR